MTIDRFLPNFERLSEAPNGIPKLRDLILQLAFRGKLVPQDPSDLAPPFAGTPPTHLPGTWRVPMLGEVLEVQNGFAFKSRHFNNVAEGLPLVRIRDIMKGSTEVHYSGDYREGFLVSTGDILIGMDGNFNVSKWQGGVALLNQRVCRLVSFSEAVERDYVFYGIRKHLERIRRESKNYTTVVHLSAKQVRAIRLPIPPLAEQKRIVAKVDELMTLCDELEAKQQAKRTKQIALNRASLHVLTQPNGTSLATTWPRVRDRFDGLYTMPETVAELRRTILQLAVMGRLVPQDPADGPASELLKRIQAEKQRLVKEGLIRKPKPLPPIEPDEVPYRLSSNWEWVRFGELGYFLGGGTPRKSDPSLWDGGIPWVTPKDMKVVHVRQSQDSISERALSNSSVRMIPAGALLMVVRGMILQHSFPVAVTETEVTVNQDMKALVPYLGSTAIFLMTLLWGEEPRILGLVERSTHGTCRLSSDRLFALCLPLPPLAEQKRIVAKVDQLMALCDDLETKLQRAQADVDNLLTAIVHELVGGMAGAPR